MLHFARNDALPSLAAADNCRQRNGPSRPQFQQGLIDPFLRRGLHPYCGHGEQPRPSEKARKNPEIEGAEFQGVAARRAADRAGAGGTAQSRHQPRRKRPRLVDRPAAAAGQFARPPFRRRGRRAPRAGLDPRQQRRGRQARCVAICAPSPLAGRVGEGGRCKQHNARQYPHPCPRQRASLASDPARRRAQRGEQGRGAESAGAGGSQDGGASARQGFGESPQREFAPANYGTAATIPDARSGAGQATRLHHRGGGRRGDGAARRATRWRRSASPPPRTRWSS